MDYPTWLKEFELIEHRTCGKKLEDDSRHHSLYHLFESGYSPGKALEWMEVSTTVERRASYLWPSVVLCLIGIMAIIAPVFGMRSNPLFGFLVFIISTVFLMSLRSQVKRLAQLSTSR